MASLLKQFTIIYILCLLAGLVLFYLLLVLIHLEPHSSMGTILSFIAAMITGQRYQMANEDPLTKSTMWQTGLVTFPITLVISAIPVVGISFLADGNELAETLAALSQLPVYLWLGILLFFGLLHALCVRFGLAVGAKQAVTMKEKKGRS